MQAFHNDPAIKEKYLTRVREHQAADQLMQGHGYWEDGKGCAVGCTIHSGNHSAYETELGIPRLVAHLEDNLFERMPQEPARTWPERFLAAIPVGADLSQVFDRFALDTLIHPETGVIKFAKTDRSRAAIQLAAQIFERRLKGETVPYAELQKMRREIHDAWRAAAADADAVADAVAAADAVAVALRWRWYYGRMDSKYYVRPSERLLELLRNAPVPEKTAA